MRMTQYMTYFRHQYVACKTACKDSGLFDKYEASYWGTKIRPKSVSSLASILTAVVPLAPTVRWTQQAAVDAIQVMAVRFDRSQMNAYIWFANEVLTTLINTRMQC